MSGQDGGGDPHGSGQGQGEADVFIGLEEGNEGDARVLADLEGGEGEPISSDEEGEASEGEEGNEGMAAEDEQDDSIHTFEGHEKAVLAVAWSPTSPDLVATGGEDERGYLWRVGEDAYAESHGDVAELSGHTDSIVSLAFSADGSMLASGAMDGCVRVWECASGRGVQCLEGPGDAVEWVAWHPKGNVVLAGAADFTAWMWLATTGACMAVFSGHSGPVTCGGFTPDGRAVVTGGGEGDATLRVWSPKSGECTLTVAGPTPQSAGLTALALSADSTVALAASEDGTARIVNLSTGRVVTSLGPPSYEDANGASIEAVALSAHLPLALTGGMDGRVTVWDVAAGAPRAVCEHPEGVTRLAEHPAQPLVFTGCMDGVVRCWDERMGGCVAAWRGHRGPVQSLALAPDGRHVITGSDDGTARVFSLAAGSGGS